MIPLLFLAASVCPAPFAAEAAQRVRNERPEASPFHIECEDEDTVLLVVSDTKRRELPLASVAPAQRGRTLALALLELLDAPEPVASAPVGAPDAKPAQRLTLPVRNEPAPPPPRSWSTQGASIVDQNAIRLDVTNSFYRTKDASFTAYTQAIELRYLRNVHRAVDLSVGGAFSIGFPQIGGSPLIVGARVQAFANETLALAAELQVRPIVIDNRVFEPLHLWADFSPIAHLSLFPRRNVTLDLSAFADVRLPYVVAGSYFHVVAPGGRFGVSYLAKSAGFFANIDAQGYVNMQTPFVAAQVPYIAFREVRVGLSLGVQWKR